MWKGSIPSLLRFLDQAGNRLSESSEGSDDYAAGNLQMQLRKSTESYLTERGQTMLDRVLGNGNSILRVSAQHDFDKLVRESDLIDPESRLLISEDRRSETNNEENMQQVPSMSLPPSIRGESLLWYRGGIMKQAHRHEITR